MCSGYSILTLCLLICRTPCTKFTGHLALNYSGRWCKLMLASHAVCFINCFAHHCQGRVYKWSQQECHLVREVKSLHPSSNIDIVHASAFFDKKHLGLHRGVMYLHPYSLSLLWWSVLVSDFLISHTNFLISHTSLWCFLLLRAAHESLLTLFAKNTSRKCRVAFWTSSQLQTGF